MKRNEPIWVLIDVIDNKSYEFLDKYIEGLRFIYPPIKCRMQIQWLVGVIYTMFKSNKNDKILFVYDLQAVLFWWLSRLLFIKRDIYCINVLLDKNNRARNKIISKLYKGALLANNFHATVTSEKYGDWLNSILGIRVKYALLRDVYHDQYNIFYKGHVDDAVFCGGRNGRDWNFMISLAMRMEDVEFRIVMPSDIATQYKKLPPNVKLYHNISYSRFMNIMCGCSLVCLPLVKEAPAGLIVMFQAAANNKLVLTTETVTTVEYLNSNRGILLPRELGAWEESIRYYMFHKSESDNISDNLKEYLQVQCSEIYYAQILEKFINSF